MAPKLKIVVDHDNVNTTAYDFEKRLIEESDKNIFLYDHKGKIMGLHYLNYAKAATTLLLKIAHERKKND